MAQKLTPQELEHVAKLANLPLTPEERESFSASLSSILDLVSRLQGAATENVPPTSQVTGLVNVWRQDKIDPSRLLTVEQALGNAKRKHKGYFIVPAVFADQALQ